MHQLIIAAAAAAPTANTAVTIARGTNHPSLPETVPILALKALHARKCLSSGQERAVGHPGACN